LHPWIPEINVLPSIQEAAASVSLQACVQFSSSSSTLANTVYPTHLAATAPVAAVGDMDRLLIALLLLALAAGASAAELTEIKAWAQCGGTSCTGGGCPDGPWQDTQCAEGFKCLRMTAFFW
jgi:hypothetical protein